MRTKHRLMPGFAKGEKSLFLFWLKIACQAIVMAGLAWGFIWVAYIFQLMRAVPN